MKHFLIMISLLMSSYATASAPLLVVTEDLWPFNYLENKEIKGSATLLVKHLLEKTELDYTIELLPWARSYKLATTQENVMIYTINKTPSRLSKFHWIVDLPMQVDTNYYALSSAKMLNIDHEMIRSLRIGTLIDSVNDAYLTREKFPHVTRVSHITQTVDMLKRGRIDVIISSKNALKKALEDTGGSFQGIREVGHAFSSQPAIAMSLSTPLATVNKLQKVAGEIVQSQRLCQIMQLETTQCLL